MALYECTMRMIYKVQRYSTAECQGKSVILILVGILPVATGMQNDEMKVNEEKEAAMWFTAMLVSLCAIMFMVLGMLFEQQTNLMEEAVTKCLYYKDQKYRDVEKMNIWRTHSPSAAASKSRAQGGDTGGASSSGHTPHDDNATRPAPKAKAKAKAVARREENQGHNNDDDDNNGLPEDPRRLPLVMDTDMVYITKYGTRAHIYRDCRAIHRSEVVYEYPFCRICTGKASDDTWRT